MRKEIIEEQITALMQAIPRAEEVDRLRADNERLRADLSLEKSRIVLQRGEIEKQRAEIERLDLNLQRLSAMGSNNKWLLERLAEQRKVIERLRAALEYMVNVCPAIDPDGELAHELARNTLEGKP